RAVLGDPDLRRFSAGLRADRRRTGQPYPSVRDLCLPDRHRHRPLVRGGGGIAGDLPCAAARRDRPASLYPPGGDRLMIEGARWRRWVFFHLPLTLFIIGLLFPFYWMMVTTVRPDRELYRPWNAANYTPFWTFNPTLEHIRDLLTETLFS